MVRTNLLIIRAGNNSLHPTWLGDPQLRSFDVLIAHYERLAAMPEQAGVSYLFIPGTKITGWKALVQQYAEVFRGYKQIAFIDNDIEISQAQINTLFDYGAKHQLAIWQPALTWNSYYSFAGTVQNPLMKLRFVNSVEMMCVFFNISALDDAKSLFMYGWEVGIDFAWQSAVHSMHRRFAIVDEVVVRHTQPVGGKRHLNGFATREYADDIRDCLAHFGMEQPRLIAFGGITRSGRDIGRAGVLLRLWPLLGLPFRTPQKSALKGLLSHIARQAFHKASYNNAVGPQAAREYPLPSLLESSTKIGPTLADRNGGFSEKAEPRA